MKVLVQPTQSMDKFCIFSSESYVKVATKPNMMTETDVTKGWLLKPAATILTDLSLSWQCHPFSAGRRANMFALDLFIHDAFESETDSKNSGAGMDWSVLFYWLDPITISPKFQHQGWERKQICVHFRLVPFDGSQFWPFSNSIVHCFLSFFPRIHTFLPLSTRYHKYHCCIQK